MSFGSSHLKSCSSETEVLRVAGLIWEGFVEEGEPGSAEYNAGNLRRLKLMGQTSETGFACPGGLTETGRKRVLRNTAPGPGVSADSR